MISDPGEVKEEAMLVNEMFAEGLSVFHLRKPGWDKATMVAFLNQLNPAYINRVVIHQFREVATDYSIKRLHFKEAEQEIAQKYINSKKEKRLILSSSVHNLQQIASDFLFDYQFVSPVFSSISKKGYFSKILDNNDLYALCKSNCLVALGGINDTNLSELKSYGFYGAAFLGFIWMTGDDPLRQFKKIKNG